MQKFKRLTSEELNELEKEFIDFLVVNGIVAEDWEKLKKESLEKADSIIEQFSDVVYTQIFRSNQFLDFVSKEEIRCFQFNQKEVVLVGLKSENSHIDLRSTAPSELKKHNFKVYTKTKKYLSNREEEMFALVESGASISEGELFKNLCLSL